MRLFGLYVVIELVALVAVVSWLGGTHRGDRRRTDRAGRTVDPGTWRGERPARAAARAAAEPGARPALASARGGTAGTRAAHGPDPHGWAGDRRRGGARLGPGRPRWSRSAAQLPGRPAPDHRRPGHRGLSPRAPAACLPRCRAQYPTIYRAS